MTIDALSTPTTSSGARTTTDAESCSKSAAAPRPHAAGMLWFGGWLFTIGFVKLVWWQAILGLVIWPYFLGTNVR